MSQRVKEILSWYRSENTGILSNLYRLMMHGTLAGTGKFVILPVDQGFEHGPVRSFAVNNPANDPAYHFELALESGCNAYAAPFGQMNAAAADYAGRIPLIVKINNNDSLFSSKNPDQSVTCSIKDAIQLGATAVGFTIYPGSERSKEQYEEIRELGAEARSYGLPVVIWSYPRGEQISKDGETGIDVCCYAAHIACQLGAHIVKVKPPTAHIEQAEAKKSLDKVGTKIDTLANRVQLVVNSCFGGKRIVIFSGGPAKGDTEVIEEIKGLAAGGAFGSIMGRNAFQRPKAEGVALLRKVMDVFKG